MVYASHPLLKPNTVELREYQLSLLPHLLEKNSLVVMPTGLGKTYLAIMVACWRLSRYPEGKVLVMAPTKPLTIQHYETFKKCMNLPEEDFNFLTGERPPQERKRIWSSGRIFFATPQVVERDLISGKLEFGDFCLLVFDEAHRAVGDYSYVFIASQFMRLARSPLILALTASPGGAVERIEEVKRNLFIEAVHLKGERDRDVRTYVKPVKVEWRRVELPEHFITLKRLLEDQLEEHLSKLKEAGYLQSTREVPKRHLLELQQKLLAEREGKEPLLAHLAASLKLTHGLELLETQGIHALVNFLERLQAKSQQPGSSKADRLLASDRRTSVALSLAKRALQSGFSTHPKLEACLACVKEQLQNDPSSKILVFTNFRETAERLLELFLREGIRAEKLLGQSDRGGSRGMSQRQQLSSVRKLRDGEISVLVSTAVGEEGLDIPDVELVVFYEAVPSEIRSIQRKGRTGRTRPGRVVVLLAKGTRDEAYYWSAYWKEREMRKFLTQGKQVKLVG